MDVDAFASWMVLGLDTHHHLAASLFTALLLVGANRNGGKRK